MTTRPDVLSRIHRIDPEFNARHDRALRLAGAVTTALLVISPYSLRILLAYAINALFNRPAVYADLFSRSAGRFLRAAAGSVVYAGVLPFYALARRLGRRRVDTSLAPAENSTLESARFRS